MPKAYPTPSLHMLKGSWVIEYSSGCIEPQTDYESGLKNIKSKLAITHAYAQVPGSSRFEAIKCTKTRRERIIREEVEPVLAQVE